MTSSKTRSRTLSTTLVAALLAVASPVFAQATPPPTPGTKPTPARKPPPPRKPAIDGKAPQPGPAQPAPPPAAPAAGAPAAGAPTAGAPAAGGLPQTGELPAEKAATNCIKLNPRQKYKWDQRGEIDLAALLAWAQSSFCLPLIVPTNLRQQKVTIYAPNTMTPSEMYRMFLSALNAMGLTVQPQGPRAQPSSLIIIESNRARETSIPTLGPGEAVPNNDGYVTKVIRLEHAPVEEVLPVLNRLKSQPGDVISAPPSTLIITDVAENIRRMESVLAQLDVPLAGDRIWLIKLNYVPATEMANMLKEIFVNKAGGAGAAHRGVNIQGGQQPAGGAEGGAATSDLSVAQILPEDRSNTLIIVSSERAFRQILGLVKRLDQAGGPLDTAAGPGDRVHVYFLANAIAEDMAATLSALGISVSGSRGRSSGSSSTSRPSSTSSSAPLGTGAPSSLFEGEVKVAADKPTNSLIIVAAGRDYLTVRDIVRKLDIARRQVFIEATILEVSLDKARKIGAALHFGDTVFGGQNQSLLFGGSEPNANANSILFNPAALSGLAAGLRGPPIPGAEKILGLPPGQSIPAFGLFVQLLQNNNDVNVISVPHILTSDNEKATIQVGQNLPFPGSLGGFPALGGGLPGAPGSTPGAGFGLGFGTSVQRQDVALKLEVTPHVSAGDMVRLEVDNEISDVSSPNYNGLGPATDKRTVKTVITVRDQQPVVLGGLIKDRVSETVDKVPLLGDIPILGYLFKYSTKSVTKQNLLIILTPYIINDPTDLRRIFEKKIRERREFLEKYSSFEDKSSYEPEPDYRRKRGLLEEINRTAEEADQEADELRTAEMSLRTRVYEGPVEPAPVPPPIPLPRARTPGVPGAAPPGMTPAPATGPIPPEAPAPTAPPVPEGAAP